MFNLEFDLGFRPTFDEYYLLIASVVATRAECSRRRVGAVIVEKGSQSIVSTGYNGSPPNERSCLQGACKRAQSDAVSGTGYAESNCVALHAESNAIMRAGYAKCKGSTLYVTTAPCDLCVPLIKASGIARVVVAPERNGTIRD